ncbi:MAG TPA: tetratricopeptide repeat protein, partial [Chloroflexota bacterium]|nr:tetratricopeptide repeat protein [Chloroflexota bacterium]
MGALLERLKQRKLVQWALAYLAGAWALLQVLDLLSDTYSWPPAIMRLLPVLLAVGFCAALILAWYHGEKGQQRVSGPELVILAAVLTVGGGVLWVMGRTASPAAEASPSASSASGQPSSAVAADRSVAVLPFVNMSANPEQEYFSDGITEDILGKLSRIDGVRVTSRTSVMSYKGTKKPLREISQELGVSHVLEGSVRRAGDRLRINVQLVNALTDQSLWSETYDRDVTDVFAVQSEIAERIAAALRVRLTAGERARMGEGGTENFAAYDLYLRGRELLLRIPPGVAEWQAQYSGAIALFRQALELDPGYARAYAGLTWGYSRHPNLPPALRFDSSVVFGRQAIRLAPDLPDGYSELGWPYLYRWETELAAEQFQRALQLDPNHVDAIHGLAVYHERRGRYAEVLRHMKRVASLEPTEPEFASGVAHIYAQLGDFAAAEKWYRRAFFELRPNPQRGHCELAWLAYIQGHRSRVVHHLQQMLAAGRPGDFAFQCAGELELALGNLTGAKAHLERYAASAPDEDDPHLELAYLAIKAGEGARAEALLQQAEKFAQQRQEICGGRCENYRIAQIRALQGRSGEAIHYVRRAVETGWTGPYPTAPDPLLASIADDSRYRQIMADIKAHR